jgi:glycosyltransferase involved in cell wall biosynthesis
MNEVVDILLATYEGEEYITEQLDTLLAQTHRNLRIFVGDDASRDTTPDIVNDFAKRHPQKIFFHQYLDNVGRILNFSRIAGYSDADYVMLSDQDDVWHPQKVEKTLKKMKEMDATYGKKTPLLVHTDSKVIGSDGREIYPSYREYSAFEPTAGSLSHTLSQKQVIGCTVMLNRALVNLAFPIPSEAYMHDHWINLVASAFGKVGWVPDATVSYRQHGESWSGAVKRIGYRDVYSLFHDDRKVILETRLLYAKIKQANAFYSRYSHLLKKEDTETVKRFINLKNSSFFEELKTRIHYDFHRGRCWKTIYDIVASYLHGPIPDEYKIKV